MQFIFSILFLIRPHHRYHLILIQSFLRFNNYPYLNLYFNYYLHLNFINILRMILPKNRHLIRLNYLRCFLEDRARAADACRRVFACSVRSETKISNSSLNWVGEVEKWFGKLRESSVHLIGKQWISNPSIRPSFGPKRA